MPAIARKQLPGLSIWQASAKTGLSQPNTTDVCTCRYISYIFRRMRLWASLLEMCMQNEISLHLRQAKTGERVTELLPENSLSGGSVWQGVCQSNCTEVVGSKGVSNC